MSLTDPATGTATGPARPLTPLQVIARARAQIAEATGMKADSVASIQPGGSGWLLEIEMVERGSVNPANDLMGTFQVELDGGGDLLTYRRTRRYTRNQALG